MFWPELDQQHARAALRNTLYFLRQHLGAAVIVTEHDMVGIDPNELWCDLDAFDVAIRRRDYATAYQLYRGGLLDGVFISDAEPFEEWLDAQRQRRSTEARDAVAQAARRHAVAGRIDEALVWARRAREMAPLNEDAARLLITLRYVTGDRGGALDEYRRLETLLQAEHGVAPSSDTKRLAKAIRDPDSDVAAVANAIAQLPLPASIVLEHTRSGTKHLVRMHDREILDAFLETRVGMANRRGDRVAVVAVQFQGVAANGDASAVKLREQIESAVASTLRSADMAGVFDEHTLIIMPADDGALDVNALVARLGRKMHEIAVAAAHPELEHSSKVEAVWLDPVAGLPAQQLLANALVAR